MTLVAKFATGEQLVQEDCSSIPRLDIAPAVSQLTLLEPLESWLCCPQS